MPRPRARHSRARPFLGRPAAGLIAVGLSLVVGATGCAAGTPRDAAPVGVLDPAFLGGEVSPSPEATIAPEPGSWTGVEVPAGYRVVVVTAGGDEATTTILAAITDWADRSGAVVQALPDAADSEQLIHRFEQATAAGADLVIGAGAGVVDEFAYGTAQHLEQQYLVLGAQLGEPTGNVTSVIWPGATFRGTGITDDAQDAAAVTPARAYRAIDAGVAAVLHGVTGIVVSLPE